MLHPHLIARTRPLACPENVLRWHNYRITLLTPMLLRVEEEAGGRFCDEATQVVWFRDLPPVPHTVTPEADSCIIRTDCVQLILRERLEDSRILLADGRTATLTDEGNLLGTWRTLDCCDGDFMIPFGRQREQGHTIQLEKGILSRSGVALLDDSASLLLKADGSVSLRPQPEKDLYLFAYGSAYREAIQGLYAICGAPPVLPRHALGNWWSRYWAYTQQEYLALMDSFAERGLPFTVATVDMDWHPSSDLPDGADGWTGYTWNRELFPDHRAFLRQLHERRLHVTLNLHPALGVRWFEEQYPEMARRMGIDPATKQPVDFDITRDDFINAYFDLLHKPYEQDGVDFWWIDWQQGCTSAVPGLDPLWSLNHYHSLDIAKEKEQLILSRYAGIGSHRYPLGFSGDTHVTWETLQYLPGFTATASNAGYSWWSHDIGGHMFGYKDDELFVRFIQFGVFSPVNRLHSSKVRTLSKDPADYYGGKGLIAREFLRLRHAMIPFLYTASCETAEKGLALIEPMYYQWPDEADAYECGGQYLFGRQLIAAPVTCRSDACGLVTSRVWLPEGRWTDFFTGDVYQGGWQDMTRPLDSFPLLAKEGGIFVLDGAPDGNSTALPAMLDAHIFSGSGCYELIEDGDGHRAVTSFTSVQEANGRQTVTITADDPGHILPRRGLTLRLRNILDGHVTVTLNGRETDVYVRQESGYTLVRIAEWQGECRITITEQASAADRRQAVISRIVTALEAGYDLKEELWSKLCACASAAEVRALIAETALPESRQARLCEIAHCFEC
ncbi:MAG: alpha-xylosidase [Clostridia bacterium]|nr:alpha-xylosidase [Clostridia bacterium]